MRVASHRADITRPLVLFTLHMSSVIKVTKRDGHNRLFKDRKSKVILRVSDYLEFAAYLYCYCFSSYGLLIRERLDWMLILFKFGFYYPVHFVRLFFVWS